MPDAVIDARNELRAAVSEAVMLDAQDARIDEIVATIEDLIDAKVQMAIDTALSEDKG